MKKGTKIGFAIAAVAFSTVLLSSCTQSFCSQLDLARIRYTFEPGITKFEQGADEITFTDGEFKYVIQNAQLVAADWVIKDTDPHVGSFVFHAGEENEFKLTYLNAIIKESRNKGYLTIDGNSKDYLIKFDYLSYRMILIRAAKDKGGDEGTITVDLDTEEGRNKLSNHISYYSYLRFAYGDYRGAWSLWNQYDAKARRDMVDVEEFDYADYLITSGLVLDDGTLSPDVCPSKDYIAYYKSYLNSKVSTYRTCLTTRTNKYGSYGYNGKDGKFIGINNNKQVFINSKTWGEAWSKGLFEGLLVYPIGWLVDTIVGGFADSGVTAGVAAFLGIFFVTLIIRGLMLIATFKQSQSNAKMTELQPEITKIQNKYPHANESQVEKQRMGEEMQRLYKKHGVNPFTTLIVLIVQFPVFICVWGALSGSAALTNGTILGLNLSYTIKDVLFTSSAWAPGGGALTALFLFLLMAGAQTISMLLPQWIQKRKAKEVAKLGKNPAQQSQGKKMKIFTYIMLAVIIFMGFSLVSAMGIYWFIGAIFSIAQTLIMHFVSKHKKAKKA